MILTTHQLLNVPENQRTPPLLHKSPTAIHPTASHLTTIPPHPTAIPVFPQLQHLNMHRTPTIRHTVIMHPTLLVIPQPLLLPQFNLLPPHQCPLLQHKHFLHRPQVLLCIHRTGLKLPLPHHKQITHTTVILIRHGHNHTVLMRLPHIPLTQAERQMGIMLILYKMQTGMMTALLALKGVCR